MRFGLLGGSIVDANALLRSYIWHCIGIPLVASIFMAVHFWRIRKDGGISGPAPVMLESEMKAVQEEVTLSLCSCLRSLRSASYARVHRRDAEIAEVRRQD